MSSEHSDSPYYKDVNLANFWIETDWAKKEFEEPYPTDEMIQSVETELGCKLPASYVELMRQHNGGVPTNTCFATETPTSWASDHIAIANIKGIGRDKTWSLCGGLGSKQMVEEWGYPDVGICIADCPSAGHDAVFLDYTECGPEGEPEVIYIDQEYDYDVTVLAKDFESFIKGLRNEDAFKA